jgi:hypothetical protein
LVYQLLGALWLTQIVVEVSDVVTRLISMGILTD